MNPIVTGASILNSGTAVSLSAAAPEVKQKAVFDQLVEVTACQPTPKKRVSSQPIVYPIFTFRWLTIHALAVPTVFFLGAITADRKSVV